MKYIDNKGYIRETQQHSNLIHRRVAYSKIYLPNRNRYPLSFSKYVIHHKDGNKRNNRTHNLQLLTQEKHNQVHGFMVSPQNNFSGKHGFRDDFEETRKITILPIAILIAIIFLFLVGFFQVQKSFTQNTLIQTQAIAPSMPQEPKHMFDFQKASKTDQEIQNEMEDKTKKYEAERTGILSINKLAGEWSLPVPNKEYCGPCCYALEIPGYENKFIVKAHFKGDCTGYVRRDFVEIIRF